MIRGTCPKPDFVVSNTADNADGTIVYAVTELNPPCAGIANIEFRCKAETSPSTAVSIVSSIISDPNGTPIDHTVQGVTVECVGGFAVIGTVDLQAWPSGPEGIAVVLRDSGDAIVDDKVVRPADAFNLTAGSVTDTYSAEVSYPRYLSARAGGITGAAGDSVDIGSAMLPTGNLNGDGVSTLWISALSLATFSRHRRLPGYKPQESGLVSAGGSRFPGIKAAPRPG